MVLMRLCAVCLAILLVPVLCPTPAESKSSGNWKYVSRYTNWTALLNQPAAFVAKASYRLGKRPEGYKVSSACSKYVGMSYLDGIRKSRQSLCRADAEPSMPDPKSSVNCYTAPFVRVGNSTKASISLCQSRNLVLDSCAFLEGQRKGTLSKKFPLPSQGAVRLACDPVNATQLADQSSKLRWLDSIQHDVWWANATRDDQAARRSCGPDSPSLVTTPTLFVMRDRHANYAHEMEVVSMVFSFLAALNPKDVVSEGIQVVITDKAPATGFLETWARISHPHRLRILAAEPFPPGTCFASAYHVYTFAAGIGYNTNPGTVRCESPVVTGLSNWLRQLYGEGDQSMRNPPAGQGGGGGAAMVAGPAAAAAGVRGLRPPAGGIVVKNVVWLSRRNLEVVRLLLNASVGWKSMRLVRNEDEVVAGLLAAVQEWNAESCLIRRFERAVKSEYERSLTTLRPVHASAITVASNQSHRIVDSAAASAATGTLNTTTTTTAAAAAAAAAASGIAAVESSPVTVTPTTAAALTGATQGLQGAAAGGKTGQRRRLLGTLLREGQQRTLVTQGRALLDPVAAATATGEAGVQGGGAAQGVGAADTTEGGTTGAAAADDADDGDGGGDVGGGGGGNDDRDGGALGTAGGADVDDGEGDGVGQGGADGVGGGGDGGADGDGDVRPTSGGTSGEGHTTGNGTAPVRPPYMIGNNVVALDRLWEADVKTDGGCRRTNVLFKFVEGDFNDLSYHEQLLTIFRTGVLVGVHGAGLTHGFFMQPGHSAVLQLLGESYAKVAANNVFRNMATGMGNHYEDVLYGGVDVDVQALKQAVKRSMDFVAQKVMDVQLRRTGALRLVLVDQNHFSILVPPREACPNRAEGATAGGMMAAGGSSWKARATKPGK